MENFSLWFIDFFQTLMRDLGHAFSGFFNGLINLIFRNPIRYILNLSNYASSFNILDWIITILALIIILILLIAFYILMFQLLRRYVRFVKTEKQKTELLFEVGSLNKKITKLVDEKNAYVALSGNTKNHQTKNKNGINPRQNTKQTTGRFTKLIQVDEAYKYKPLNITMKTEPTLKNLVDDFINFSASNLGLFYDKATVATFIAGMSASKTMILEGISGTGKTSLPYAFGKFFNNDAHIISVQPSWRDRFEMVGYLNEFTKRFNETDFLKAVYEASYRNDINFIVLDEMNLARVEYYFADFLSLLEMPSKDEWLLDIVPDQKVGDPFFLKKGKLQIPDNIWFVGTANKDDSTFTITDKVYDRSASIEINNKATPFEAIETKSQTITLEYLESLFKKAQADNQIAPDTLKNLAKLDAFISEKFEITFGNRIMKQINLFLPTYMACGQTEVEGLDYLVARKIIRKFEGLNLPFLQTELEELTNLIKQLFGANSFKETQNMLQKYMKQL